MAIAISTTGVILVVAAILYSVRNVGRRPKGCPPGPPTLPIIGNLYLMPKEKGHLKFHKWAEEYGPIYSLILGTKVMIVLSSDQVVKDLLDKRSTVYSSRPDMYLGSDIASGGLRVVLMEYGETWRMIRGIIHQSLNIKAARTYVPYQDLENKAMLLGLLEKPSRFREHIQRYTNSISTQMVYGFRVATYDDPRLKKLFHCVEKWSEVAGSQSAALLDVFPILRRLPDVFLPMRRYAKELHRKEYEFMVGLYLEAKKKFKAGTAKPCICADFVRAQDELKFSDGIAGYTGGSLLEAGSDTSAQTLIAFVQAMLIFPEVLKTAQREVDMVCGNRLPDLNDLPDMPYIRGCIKESMRWMPTAILGIPHATTRDDEYMGYCLPKGATVVLNVWGIHNDPSRHPNPRLFDPGRWADDNQTSSEAALNRDVSKRDQFVFGAGRRVCQGMHIADRNLFLGMSRILWAFDVERAVDATSGKELIPDMANLSDGLLVGPRPFEASFRPRSAFKEEQVREEWGKMRVLLDDDLQWKTVPEGLVWKDYEPDQFDIELKV